MSIFSQPLRTRPVLLTASLAGLAIATVLMAMPGSPAAGSVRAHSSDTCRGMFNPYQVSHSLLAPCGERTAPLTAVRSLPGGGKSYTYDVNGVDETTPIPPRGFNPVTASAAKLAEYGFPPRPSGGRALRTWLTVMRRAHPVKPPAYLVVRSALTDLHPEGSADDGADAALDSNYWAGNMATSETYTNVYGYWLEPSITEADCPADYQAEVTWAGLGGQNTNYLAQAGTGYGFSGMSAHEAWYEFFPASAVPVPEVTATVGGEMYVNIYRASSKGYDIFIENEYTGAYWPTGSDFKSESDYDGSTAEFIVEDPNYAVAYGWYLIRFGTFEVQDAEASVNDSTFEGLASWPHTDVVMYSQTTGDELAHAGAAFNNGDSWYDYHDGCQ